MEKNMNRHYPCLVCNRTTVHKIQRQKSENDDNGKLVFFKYQCQIHKGDELYTFVEKSTWRSILMNEFKPNQR